MEWDYISVYTRADAIRDGVLVDLTELFPDICRQCYKIPVAITQTLFNILKSSADVSGYGLDSWVQTLLQQLVHNKSVQIYPYGQGEMVVAEVCLPDPITVNAVVGPGDDPRAVLTIMLPGED